MRNCALIVACLLVISACGCATVVSSKKTNELSVGMTPYQVKEIMGDPTDKQILNNLMVLRYDLYQQVKGWVPYYLVFNKDTQKLEQWYADEEEYYKQQQIWLQNKPKKIYVETKESQDITIKDQR